MYERFRARPPFATWTPEILRAYCDYALLPVDGAFELACAPTTEAALYRASRALESNPYRLIPSIEIPVTVIRAGKKSPPGVFDLSASFTWEGLAACFPRGREVFLADRNHFLPMEAPEIVAAEIAATAAEKRLSLPRG
jgi:pimeloyl-ACP methyl ester carboxylesterase